MLGYLNLLIGSEGIGKGVLISWVLARLTRGQLPGDMHGTPVVVGIIADEDSFDGVWTPRLHAVGADFDRVRHLEREDGWTVDLSEDAERLRLAADLERVRVLFLDALLDVLGVGVDDGAPSKSATRSNPCGRSRGSSTSPSSVRCTRTSGPTTSASSSAAPARSTRCLDRRYCSPHIQTTRTVAGSCAGRETSPPRRLPSSLGSRRTASRRTVTSSMCRSLAVLPRRDDRRGAHRGQQPDRRPDHDRYWRRRGDHPRLDPRRRRVARRQARLRSWRSRADQRASDPARGETSRTPTAPSARVPSCRRMALAHRPDA